MKPERSLPYSQEPATCLSPVYINPIYIFASHFSKKNFNLILRSKLSLPNDLFLSCWLRFCMDLSAHVHATSFAHLILDLITLIRLGEEYKLWSFPYCSFHHPAFLSFLISPNMFVLFSRILHISYLRARNHVLYP